MSLWPGCDKSYRRLQHLNAHIEARGHGFKESLRSGRFALHRRALKLPRGGDTENVVKPFGATYDRSLLADWGDRGVQCVSMEADVVTPPQPTSSLQRCPTCGRCNSA